MYTTVLLAMLLLVSTVLMHYEGLRVLSMAIEKIRMAPRPRMLLVIFGVILLHVLEIALYGSAYWFAVEHWGLGEFAGIRGSGMHDYLYFSAETYTSLGLGDIYPIGDLRLIASIEVLNGLLLLGWSGSFTYLVMQRFWTLHLGR